MTELSRAQELLHLHRELGTTQSRLATYMGVADNTVSRWLRQGRSDEAGTPAKDGLEPDRHRILHLRALVALKRACPGLLLSLSWTKHDFTEALGQVQGEALLLEGELDRSRRGGAG